MTMQTNEQEYLLGVIETVITGLHRSARILPRDRVAFHRDPENRRDPNAVRVENSEALPVGYLPRRVASWLGPLLDRRAVEIRGKVTDDRRVRHGLIPLDLRLHPTAEGRSILQQRENPGNTAEAFHNMVLATWRMADQWTLPKVIRDVHEHLLALRQDDALPETHMLLALFPWKAAEASTRRKARALEDLKDMLANVVLGEALHHHNLTLFPIYTPNGHEAEYLLLAEALATGNAEVREMSESGSVPELLLANLGEKPILVPEGEVLTGEKQNRTVNITVMVPPQEVLVLPVSCVEQGRWHRTGLKFSTTHYAPPELRASKSRSVNRSRMASGAVHSDQGRVWVNVAETLSSMNVNSPTGSLTEGMDRTEDRRREYRERLRLPSAAAGVLAASGDRVMGVDLFDTPRTLEMIWPRLADAYFFQASMAPGETPPTSETTARAFLRQLANEIRPVKKPVGDGEEFIIEGETVSGNALWHDNRLCHLSAHTVRA